MAETMGQMIREARRKKKLTLRKAASILGIPPSYLSDIENDRRPPSERVMGLLEDHLGLTRAQLDQMDGRLEPELRLWAERKPQVRHLLRKIKDANVDMDEVEDSLRHLFKDEE